MTDAPANPYRIGGASAEDLVQRFGTPLYVYDASKIRERLTAFFESVTYRPFSVFYSIKAHPSVQLLSFLRSLGAKLDACSPGDLAFATAAGYAGSEVTYTGYSMSDRELQEVARFGCCFVADSLSQVERMARMGSVDEVALRVNFGIARGFHPHVQFGARDSKFGIHDAYLADAVRRTRAYGLTVVGVHSHAGSDLLDPQDHMDLLGALVSVVLETPELRDSIRFIDMGGGWGTPFLPEVDMDYPMGEFGARASAMMTGLSEELGRQIELRVEPGAYVVMDAGVLLTSVNEIKASVEVDGERTPSFVGTDTSYNHVHSAVAYGTYHRIAVAERPSSPPTTTYHITGNLMQAGDVIAKDRPLPEVRVGDVLVIEKCGGYKACRAPTFNERPRPGEVLVDGERVTGLRRPETVTDLLHGQCLETPDYCWDDGVKWAETPFNSELGRFRLVAYEFPDGREHIALIIGEPSTAELPLIRVQSACVTGTGLLAQLCDCRQQLHLAMQLIAAEPAGCLLYLDQEGRSHGLVEKVAQLKLISEGMDTVEAAAARNRGADRRDYEQAAWILHSVVGLRPMRLLTNNPAKAAGLEAAGVEVGDLLHLQPPPTPTNLEYLRVKRDKLGHVLTGLEP